MEDEIIPILNTDYKPVLTSEAQGSTVTPHLEFNTNFKEPEPREFPKFEARMPKDIFANNEITYGRESSSNSGDIPDWRSVMNPKGDKIELNRHVPMTETHTLSEDGKTWTPKYDKYTYGLNNETTSTKEKQVMSEAYKDAISIVGQVFLAIIIAGVIILLYNLINKSRKSI